MLNRPALPRRLLAELLGTAGLVAVVVGSGIAASRLSPDDAGLQLLENAVATGLGLFVLILVFGPVSGAHFNPVVSLADAVLGRFPRRDVLPYVLAQCTGGVLGAVLANLMFDLAPVNLSGTERSGGGLWLSEVTATTFLLLVVFCLARSGLAGSSPALTAGAVGAYIGAAYFFTSSTSFANPAVTLGRVFSDTFAGISPASAPGFVLAQLVGFLVAVGLVHVLYPVPVQDDVLVRSQP
ncbi:MAG: low molecular weight phosphotyrosine protein phosphatase [Frankiales bacterium]|nr:low molecular weight phosphotyrosine protein phosphatase [Frankiales bacterium]